MLDGIFPPLPTPFAANEDLDLGLLRELVARLNGTGLSGYVALGSNGEAVHLAPEERDAVVRAVRDAAAPGMRVLAGTGQPGTRGTIEATRRAADCGAEAALVLTPAYYGAAKSADALRRHFEKVADASPIPILLYNVPGNTGLNMPVEVAAALAGRPNVAGMKDSAGDAAQLAAFVEVTRGKAFTVFSGSFGTLVSGVLAGAAGGILAVANVAPAACVEVYRLARAGRAAEAAALHERLLPLAKAVTARWGVPGLKAAMEMAGAPCGVPRGPLLPLPEAARLELAIVVRDAGIPGCLTTE